MFVKKAITRVRRKIYKYDVICPEFVTIPHGFYNLRWTML